LPSRAIATTNNRQQRSEHSKVSAEGASGRTELLPVVGFVPISLSKQFRTAMYLQCN
jgi:hypothetical protein